MVDLTQFKTALDAARSSLHSYSRDPRGDFISQMQAHGFSAPRSGIVVGQLERVDGPEDKPGKLSGWYIYNEFPSQGGGDVIGCGSYGCWKTDQKHSFLSCHEHKMGTAERLAFHSARQAQREAEQAETTGKQIEAARLAREIWDSAHPASNDHPYLKRKNVLSHGLKHNKDGRLIVPIMIDGEISSLEFIDDNGQKRRLTGGKCKGGYYAIHGDGHAVYICEGYSTGASVHEATGCTTYISFNANNLYEVAATVKRLHQDKTHIIAGDDDTETPGNPGRTKAQQAADAMGMEAIFPPMPTDFNDFHTNYGIDAVKHFLLGGGIKRDKIPAIPEMEIATAHKESPPGIIQDIASYYNATAGNPQPLFAIQAALATCSVILSRSYISDRENYTSMFFLNLAKSGTGKEHSKTVIEKILTACNLAHLINGDGYTSAGAVFSALLNKPRHISVIDEFGRYIEAGRDLKNGSHLQREANTKLMESFSRCNGILRPQSYSTMTLKKSLADEINNRVICNPALTIYGMSTPDTFINAMNIGAVKDGFINRFMVAISDAARSVRVHKPPLAVPERIIDWAKAVTNRYGREHSSDDKAQPVELTFTQDALALNMEFQQRCIDKANELETYGMAELPGRSSEMTMRLALICSLAENPMAETIEARHIAWANDYVGARLNDISNMLKRTLSNSDYEKNKKEILLALRDAGEDGMLYSKMMKTPPFSQHKQKDLNEILSALREADLVIDEIYINPKGGRPTKKWVAV